MPLNETAGTARVIAPPPLIYGAALAAGWLLHKWRPMSIVRNRNATNWTVGTALITAGVGISASVVSVFRRSGTPVSPLRPTRCLTISGPYRFSRNPDYIGQLLAYTGTSIVSNTWWPLLMLPVLIVSIDRGVVQREERYLEKMFGEQYRNYTASVRRWI